MNYRIYYDVDLDAWNWADATHQSSYGQNWREKLSLHDDLAFFDNLSKLSFKDAEKFARKVLAGKYQENRSELDRKIAQIDADFALKFARLCEVLENITHKKLFYQNYDIKITTFPKGPYNFAEHFFGYFINNYFSLEQTFLHEVLHFQFIAYWRNDSNSPVSKLSDNEFNFLNESLIVVLYDYEDLVGKVFHGHPAQKKFMKVLREQWTKSNNFNELVEFGLKKLSDFLT